MNFFHCRLLKIRSFVTLFNLFFILTVSSVKVSAQSFIEYSKLEDTVFSSNTPTLMQVVNGEAYTLSVSYGDAPDFITVSKLTKYRVDGSVEYTTIINPDSTFEYASMNIINGEVYLYGREVAGFSSVNAIIKLPIDGTVAFTKIYPLDFYTFERLAQTDEALISGQVTDPDFPMTMGGAFPNIFGENGFIGKLSLTTGEITQSMYLGFSPYSTNLQVDNGAVYLTTNARNSLPVLPVTIGNIPTVPAPGSNSYMYVEKLNLANFSTIYRGMFLNQHFLN